MAKVARTILLVEASEALGAALKEPLRSVAPVIICRDADELSLKLEAWPPRLIVVDFRLSRTDAVEVLATLRTVRDVPILVLAWGTVEPGALPGARLVSSTDDVALLAAAARRLLAPPRLEDLEARIERLWPRAILLALTKGPLQPGLIVTATHLSGRDVQLGLEALAAKRWVRRQGRTRWMLTPAGRAAIDSHP